MNISSLISRTLALLLFIASLPILLAVLIAIKLEDGGPLIFSQKRAGKGKKTFTMYKIRTMGVGAERLKKKYLRLNEADGPVFKIRNDPRYTKVGKILARTGLDELPQLINVIKGEMAFIGPRPLPPDEARGIPKTVSKRFSVLPGITSSWVVRGAHNLSFSEWMKLDLEYVERKSFLKDLEIIIGTLRVILKEAISILKLKWD